MKTDIYNQKGEKTGDITLPEGSFDLPWNADLVHQVVVSMQSNLRTNVAHVKTRGDVAGTGKKPWRQKGTGRARHGQKQSPIWRGGGITHGPSNERNFTKKINKKMRKKAFLTTLSQKMRDNEVLFLDKLIVSEPKTKEATNIIKSVSKVKGFEKMLGRKKNNAIFVLPAKEAEATRAFSNIPGVATYETRNLNTLDLLTYKHIVFIDPKATLEILK